MSSDTMDLWAERAVRLIALGFAAFVFWTAAMGQFPNIQQRATALALTFAIGFLLYPSRIRALGAWARLIDLALLGVTVAACLYVILNYWDIMMFPADPSPLAVALGIGLCATIFELSRRTIGWSFGILMLVFGAYALWGHLIPGRLGHAPASLGLLVDTLYMGTGGIWGELMDVYASLLVLFVLFSSLMMATGAGQSFIDIGQLVAGRFTGGPAKIAVVASAFVGSVTGSSVTNVAMTGTFTIPMMKRLGYRPEVAGAIEATASSGGQITPPMMGAGLFLMAEMLDMGVGQIMLVAAIPALLFYISVLSAVHFESRREGVSAVPKEELPQARDVLAPRLVLPVVLPFAVLIGSLGIGFSAQRAILYAILCMVAAYLFCAPALRDIPKRLMNIVAALADSGRALVTMGALMAAAAMVVSVIGFFGIGPKLSELVLSLGQGHLVATLLLSGFVVMVIGMGVPTTAAYVLGASVIALALQKLGVEQLSAHMFIFYFATLSALTPPVCAAVFVAAGIAEAHWLAVAWQTVRFAVIKYILPFIFVFHPALLLQGSTLDFLQNLAFVSIGAIGLSAAFAGFLFTRLRLWEQIALGLISAAVLWPEPITSMAALIPLAGLAGLNWVRARSQTLTAA